MTLRASLWVPADVHFIVRLPSNNQFFRQSCRISRIFFCAVMQLASSGNHNDDGNEKLSQKNSECAAGILAGFFAFLLHG